MFRSLGLLIILVFALVSVVNCAKFSDGDPIPLSSARSQLDKKGYATVSFARLGISAAVQFDQFPTVVGELHSFQLKFWKTDAGSAEKGPFINPGYPLVHPGFRVYMPAHKHGSDERFEVIEQKTGGQILFQVNNVKFTMAGEWRIEFRLKDAQGALVDEADIYHEQR